MNPDRPKISLLISTYNWPEALELVLLSVARQTVMPDEVIIADDGSKQPTTDLINSMRSKISCPVVHIWHEDTGFKLAQIRNKAIVKAKGNYIIQIDGDVILERHFIKDHMRLMKKGCFVSGSRINMREELSKKIFSRKQIRIPLYTKGLKNKLNGFRCCLLSKYYRFRYKKNRPYYVKGCNMAFWKKDLIAVNGYNENMTGWGREDSEIAARLIASGIRRQFLKCGGVQYHLYHTFSSRERENININIFENTVATKSTFTKDGLDKYI